MKEDHERIWLQSADDAAHCTEGRLWCQDKVWPADKEDGEPTEYVRADLLATARADGRREAFAEVAGMAEERGRIALAASASMPDGPLKEREAACGAELAGFATAIRAMMEKE